jgi:hypothetical protein
MSIIDFLIIQPFLAFCYFLFSPYNPLTLRYQMLGFVYEVQIKTKGF